jgi:hypothetical protein
MSIETFTTLIDDLVRAGKRPLLNFAWSGEPTLNKALPDFIDYAAWLLHYAEHKCNAAGRRDGDAPR